MSQPSQAAKEAAERILVHGPMTRQHAAEIVQAAIDAETAKLNDIITGFLTRGHWLGISHPHLANYAAFPPELWDAARLSRVAAPERPKP